ncbi:Intraflagellar transport protein 56 [Phlyctochytrium planicorne]|nr:Intraflagellar transport protein 56 [Phlyctochytrium planicorne]
MILSRAKPAHQASSSPTALVDKRRKIPKLDHFISSRDYTGAITILEVYTSVCKDGAQDVVIFLYMACCMFFLGMYKEADEAAQKGPSCKLQNRLLFHLSHKFNDEKRLMGYHQNLQDVIEDQLCLASIHYLRSHYQEAIDIYKRILVENRDFLAINVYVAMCYYKLDYYDVSQEVLSVYLQHFPDSVIAINLKACNHFRLYNGKAAESELSSISDRSSATFKFGDDLIQHNMVVFRNGDGALQVFPSLLDAIPEARLNLVIYYLRNDDIVSAYNLMKDIEPATPQEYILKGIVNATLGQDQDSRDHLKIAQQYFQLGYFYNDDTFNFNYGEAKIASGCYEEAEEILSLVQNEKLRSEYAFVSHLARCFGISSYCRALIANREYLMASCISSLSAATLDLNTSLSAIV